MKAHAELAEIWPRDGRIRLVGHLHRKPEVPDHAPWQLLLIRREAPEHQLRYAAPLAGVGFDVTLDIEDLVPEHLAAPVKWDVYLAVNTGTAEVRLRAGRLLDDIKGKKNIMVFPLQYIDHATGTVAVQPFYTVKDNLSLECRPYQPAEHGPAVP